jgi:hypothetical protein
MEYLKFKNIILIITIILIYFFLDTVLPHLFPVLNSIYYKILILICLIFILFFIFKNNNLNTISRETIKVILSITIFWQILIIFS